MPSAFLWLMLVPSSLRLPAPVNQGVRSFMLSRTRFIVKGVLGTIFTLAAGATLVYASVNIWLVGKFSSRGHLIHKETEPIQFLFFTGLSGLFGLALVCYAPIFLRNVLKATDSEVITLSQLNPKIFGKTRPSIFWLGLVLVGGFILAACLQKSF